MNSIIKRACAPAGAVALVLFLLTPGLTQADGWRGGYVTGTWYLALDAEPFGLPPGLSLPGVASFHLDRTLQIVDGGDFGGLPFTTRDTAQLGSWKRSGRKVEAVTLFLLADGMTGDVLAWQRVHLTLYFDGRDRLKGKVNVFGLPCQGPAPFPVFNCADPIANAANFVAQPPFDVPVTLSRLKP